MLSTREEVREGLNDLFVGCFNDDVEESVKATHILADTLISRTTSGDTRVFRSMSPLPYSKPLDHVLAYY